MSLMGNFGKSGWVGPMGACRIFYSPPMLLSQTNRIYDLFIAEILYKYIRKNVSNQF